MADLTIITIHLNDFDGLQKTIQSLRPLLSKENVEWIVVDGGSGRQDGDILERAELYADKFISETDEGIYDAMNKGTCFASGDYVLYLNAGDELHPKFNLSNFDELASESHPDMIWGNCQEHYENGSLVQVKTRSPSWAWYCMPVYHPATFFRRDILGSNPYDVRYRIAADYELICRLLNNGAEVKNLDTLVSIFHRGGLSDVQGDATREEENQIRLKYFNVPAFAGTAIKNFKTMNVKLAKIAWLRRLWRKWI